MAVSHTALSLLWSHESYTALPQCGSKWLESEILRDRSWWKFTYFQFRCSTQETEMKDIAFLEGILAAVTSQDTQRRLKAAEDFSNYLSVPSNGIEFIGFDKLLDGLVGWVNSSNFKVRNTLKKLCLWNLFCSCA